MSGSSNALLDALANPRQVDVVGAYGNANRLAAGIWANRLAQAQQLSGQAQQDATAPDGTYSPDQYRANLKNAGPGAALAAQSGYAANQALSSDQLNQARDKLGWVAKASGAALTAGDFSDAGMMRVLMQGSADNMLTIPEITKQLQSLPPDAAGRKAWLEQHQNQAMSTQQQLELRYGKMGTQTGPDGRTIGTRQSVQTGAVSSPPQPGAPLGVSPETAFTAPPAYVPDTRPGAAPNATTPVPRSVPGAVPPPVPSPNVGGGVYKPRPVAPTPTPAPATDVTGGTAPQTYLAPPQGQPAALAADQDLYREGAKAVQGHVTNVQNIDTALKALELTRAGPSSAAVHNIYAFLKEQGVTPPFIDNDVTQWAIANKAMSGLIGGLKTGTDLSTHITQDANANMHIDQDAARHVLIQRAGWENQAIAMQKMAPDGGGGMHGHVGKFPTDTVPEAFAWNRYTQPERTSMIAAAKKDGTYAKLAASLKIAIDTGLVPKP